MVTVVSYLGGRDLDAKGVREFIAGLGLHVPAALAPWEVARVLAPVFGGASSARSLRPAPRRRGHAGLLIAGRKPSAEGTSMRCGQLC